LVLAARLLAQFQILVFRDEAVHKVDGYLLVVMIFEAQFMLAVRVRQARGKGDLDFTNSCFHPLDGGEGQRLQMQIE
jgi:hypothetical protein